MVQTLAALLSWIAILALISIGALLSGIWRPRAAASAPKRPAGASVHPLQTASQARAQAEAIAQAKLRRSRQDTRRAA